MRRRVLATPEPLRAPTRALRILSRSDVEGALDLDVLVDAIAQSMRKVSAGEVSLPPRLVVDVPEHEGLVAAMAAHVHGRRSLTTKLLSVYPNNAPGGPPTHQSAVMVFDAIDGAPVAIMDGSYITAARAAAASRLATRLLARPDPEVLAILGAGVQGEAQAEALLREYTFRELRITSGTAAAARSLAERLHERTDVRIVLPTSYEQALAGADVVCAATPTEEPIVCRHWLDAGAHVNSIGSTPTGREVDAETVRDALVVVEARAAALAPSPVGANDLNWPIADGVVNSDHISVELGHLVAGTHPGRTRPDQITLYKSVGIAVEDDAAAMLVMDAAERQALGQLVEL